VFVGAAGGGRRAAALAAALISLGCALAVPSAATAVTFAVNSAADEVDAAQNGVCLTGGGKCTLRAALEEANPTSTNDIINFDVSLFDGTATGEITLNSGLPKIVNPVRIRGACVPAGGSLRPCVGIEGKSSEPALSIENATGVQIDGLAITAAQTGILMKNAASFRLRTTWIGAKLDGSVDGNEVGVFIGPGSPESQVGSEGAGFGNVFADSTEDGLQLEGASGARIFGNYFGVAPNGTTPAPNDEDIEIVSVSGSPATGSAIGTKVSAAAAATPACDGGCNVISGATSNGIDLQGDGGAEEPAQATTVRANYIGLDANGSAAIANGETGILVGEAEQTVIGGPKAEEANRINGGSTAVLAGPGAGDLVVHGNRIGADAAGTGTLAPPDEGIVVDSKGLTSAAVEAAIVDNRIRMDDGVAVSQEGFGARIADNEVDGAETAIEVFGDTKEHGNSIEGNSLEGPGQSGILVESSFNEIVGNEIFGAGEAGVLIEGETPSTATGNVVGGDTAADENVITGSAGNAIEIVDVEKTDNEIARNRGIVNSGLFIDLVAISPDPNGPNHGIKPPAFATATATGSSGTAEVGARVRVFRKQVAEAGELDSFLGEAIAGPEGEWEVAYGSSLPGGAIVAATQTSELGGTSELATATTPTESGGGGGGGGGGAGSSAGAGAAVSGPGDLAPPETAILKAPKKKIHSHTARFEFDSDEVGMTFQCKLDGKPFKACKSPRKYQGLRLGKHVFEVRAVDLAGNADPTPAKRKFTVLEGSA